MKKIMLLLWIPLLIVGCTDLIEQSNNFSDASWYTSETKKHATDSLYNIKINNFISFMDVSQGALTHEWIIEDGNVFLNDKFDINNVGPSDFNLAQGTRSEAVIAHVYFKKQGRNKVILRNTFKDYVKFNGKNTSYEAKKVGDVWVFEREFYVEVYGNMSPLFEVRNSNGTVLLRDTGATTNANQSSWKSIEIEVGDKLTFVDLTTQDRPSGRTWTVNGSMQPTSTMDVAEFEFLRIGTFTQSTIVSRRNIIGIPTAETQKFIPLNIVVKGTNKPYTLYGKISQSASTDITFSTYGEVSTESNFTAAINDFTVHVKNDSALFDQNISIQSIKINSLNPTALDIKLNGQIYNTDLITVTYNGNSIKSKDNRFLQNFTNEIVVMKYEKNLCNPVLCGFETIGTTSPFVGWRAGFTDILPYLSQSTDKVANGSYSLKLEILQSQLPSYNKLSLPFMTDVDNTISVELNKRYLLKFKIWLDANTENVIDNFQVEFVDNNSGSIGPKPKWDFPILKGQWIQIQQEVVFTENSELFKNNKNKVQLLFRFYKTRIRSDVKFYIDDVEMFSGIEDRK